jgi:predicted GNAT family acetyltransferase
MSVPSPAAVTNDAAAQEFRLATPAGPARLGYHVRESDGALDLVHTEVPKSLEGQGYGTALAEAAIEAARRDGVLIIPTCPFVQHYVDTHPDVAPLVGSRVQA